MGGLGAVISLLSDKPAVDERIAVVNNDIYVTVLQCFSISRRISQTLTVGRRRIQRPSQASRDQYLSVAVGGGGTELNYIDTVL